MASVHFSTCVDSASALGRYNPGGGRQKVEIVARALIPTLTSHGQGDGKLEMVGASVPDPKAAVMQINVTDPTLVGGTLSSMISIEIFNQPPSIPTSTKSDM